MSALATKIFQLAQRPTGLTRAELDGLEEQLRSLRQTRELEVTVLELMKVAAALGPAGQASGDAILRLCTAELPALREYRFRAPESRPAKEAWARASGARKSQVAAPVEFAMARTSAAELASQLQRRLR